MADLTITAANVRVDDAQAQVVVFEAGEAITAGKAVYLNSLTSKIMLSATTDATVSACVGVAISPAAADGDYCLVANKTGMQISPGATMTVGQLYYLSSNGSGAISPYADVVAANGFVTAVYRAVTTTIAKLELNATGIEI